MTTQTTLFKRKKVERFCSLEHVATNRIWDTFDYNNLKGTLDKNRVCAVVKELIDYVREFKHE